MIQETRPIPLGSIVAEDSLYRLSGTAGKVDTTDPRHLLLLRSLERLGMQTPLLVQTSDTGELHLMEGFRRLEAARGLGWETAPCRVLPPDIPLPERLDLLLSCRWGRLQSGIVPKSRFLNLALGLGLPRKNVLSRIMPLLQLEGHEWVLRHCEAVAALPAGVLDYCELKGFSLKQCTHLSRHPGELLELVFAWRERLGLTASIVAELLEHIRDYLRAHHLTTKDFLDLPNLREVMDAPCSVQERTRRLRRLVRSLRFPLLTEVEQRMEGIRRRMGLPANVRASWDPSLEQRAVELHITLNDPQAWPATRDGLAAPSIAQGIEELLEEL